MKLFFKKFKIEIVMSLTMLLLILLFNLNYSLFLVNGESMLPTLKDKQLIILKKDKSKEKGQIAVLSSNGSWTNKEKKLIKRIIALENDNVSIENDSLIVNNELVANIKDKKCKVNNFKFTVPEKYVFVVGDNYGNSNDSLTQLCLENDDYLIHQDKIIVTGKLISFFEREEF